MAAHSSIFTIPILIGHWFIAINEKIAALLPSAAKKEAIWRIVRYVVNRHALNSAL